VNSLLFTAWENADFVARIHPEFGTATQPKSLAPFQSSFSVFFHIPKGPAQVKIRPKDLSFAAAIEAFCKAMIMEDNHPVHLFKVARNADYPFSECFLSNALRYISIIDQIRTEIVARFDHILSPFADWLFRAGCSLLVRQVIAVLRALESLLLHRESFQNGRPLPNDVSKRFAVLSREVAVLSLLLNAWGIQTNALDLFWKEFSAKDSDKENLKLEALILKTREHKDLRTIRETTPFYFDGKVFTTRSVFRPPIEHILLNVALFNFGNGDAGEIQELHYPDRRPTIPDAFRLFHALGRVHWTHYLADLAAFGDDLQEIFHKQLNLVYVILSTLRCGDLRDISVQLFGAEPY
jgi:hypothetical protein